MRSQLMIFAIVRMIPIRPIMTRVDVPASTLVDGGAESMAQVVKGGRRGTTNLHVVVSLIYLLFWLNFLFNRSSVIRPIVPQD